MWLLSPVVQMGAKIRAATCINFRNCKGISAAVAETKPSNAAVAELDQPIEPEPKIDVKLRRLLLLYFW